MTKPRFIFEHVTLLLVVLSLLSTGVQTHAQNKSSEQFDHAAFNTLLAKHVNDKGQVNYKGFKSNALFKRYIKALTTADISLLAKNEKLALYINAYNALVIHQVVDNLPISSPMDVKGFFTDERFTVAGEKLSLNTLEKKHIIPLGGSLVHFALVCAARSCPKLLPKAYTGESLNSQLAENARSFVRDKTMNRLDRKVKTLYLSKIFDWYKDDFKKDYGSVRSFIQKYILSPDNTFLSKNKVSTKYLSYDWQLNSQ